MFKRIVVLFYMLCPVLLLAQDFSEFWEGHFSYNSIKDVTASEAKMYAASDNAVFTLDLVTQEINTLSTVQGLAGELISTIHYSSEYEALVIGYQNGLIEIYLEQENRVLQVVDIVDKATIPPTSKQINHFNEFEGALYIATNFGISVYNLERLEFGDTYFIGDSGMQSVVTQTTVSEGVIYASGLEFIGLKQAELSNPNLIDYRQWTKISATNFIAVQDVSNTVYAIDATNQLFKISNGNITGYKTFSSPVLDVKSANSELVVTTANQVYLYDSNLRLVDEVFKSETYNTNFTSAITTIDRFFMGSEDYGVLSTEIGNSSSFTSMLPDGPLSNAPFSVEAVYNNIWVTYGDYTTTYNPHPLRTRGFSHSKNGEWANIPSDSVQTARNLNEISVNPNRISEVYISSFEDGILKVENDVSTLLYNQSNSGLEPIDADGLTSIRVSASTFDNDGVLWSLSGRNMSPLKSYNPESNQWQSYSFDGLFSDGLNDEWGYSDIAIDNAGVVWMGGYLNGVIGYDYNSGNPLIKSINSDSQNMPDAIVTAVTLDNRNQLWIGTPRGLRVLYNTSSFFTDANVQASEIIILDDGIPKELLSQEYITSIAVDGSNNKWIGTIGSGLFYFTPDGQETIYHFTTDNSPLPSNSITDIALDGSNGKVVIATESGLVSFNSGSSEVKSDYSDAYVYPNPVRPTFNITEDKVKIKGLTEDVNIKITDVEGNLVAEAQANINSRFGGYNLEVDGGTAFWNGRNLANNVVRSGVYLIMLSDTNTFETRVLKLMIVR